MKKWIAWLSMGAVVIFAMQMTKIGEWFGLWHLHWLQKIGAIELEIYPEQVRWFNEKELKDWLEGKRDCSDTAYESLIIQHLIDDLDEMHDAEHTVKIDVEIKTKGQSEVWPKRDSLS